MRPTLPAGTERGGRPRVQVESCPALGGQVDPRIPAGLSRGCGGSKDDDSAHRVRPARLAHAVYVGIQGGGTSDESRGPLQSPSHGVDSDNDVFEVDLLIRRVRAATH
jgi:hypothetical protein